MKELRWLKICSSIWWCSNGIIREEYFLVIFIYCVSASVRFLRYSNWYDCSFEDIESAGTISATVVAGGIKQPY